VENVMRYTLEQLETFAVVAQAGSFSAAGRKLGKTQSTVSVAIANLEVDLRVELFDRSSKIPTLTAAGVKLLAEAETILERCRELGAHANSLSNVLEPRITLAIEIPYRKLIEPLRAFAGQFLFVDLDIRNPVHGDVHEMVLSGEAQLGIAFAKPDTWHELGFMQMGKLILSHVVHRDHPLARQRSVSFETLHTFRHLVFSAHSTTLPSSEYFSATSNWQVDNYLALLEMTRAGLGWTSMPRQLILGELERGELVELSPQAYPHTDWLVGVDLIWSKRQPLGKAAEWLKECFASHKVFELDRNGQSTTL
jgi:DNA-binding transcriptional LysR family regulator